MLERIRLSISRAPIVAVAVAVLAGYLVARGCSSSRYAIVGISTSGTGGAYVLDTWTGNVRLWMMDCELKVESLSDQKRGKLNSAQ